MRLGATLAHLADAPPFAVVEWARRLVDAGFESLWAPEIIGRGTLVPDPFVVLAAAAAATRDVELGTATVQVPLHHPADLAHRMLSLRAVCGDRLTLGVSPGSTATDYATLDRDYATRSRRSVTTSPGCGCCSRTVATSAPSSHPRVAGRSCCSDRGARTSSERRASSTAGWRPGCARRPRTSSPRTTASAPPGGARAIVCAVPVDDLEATGAALRRYRASGFDDAVVVFAPTGPGPDEVRALLPRDP